MLSNADGDLWWDDGDGGVGAKDGNGYGDTPDGMGTGDGYLTNQRDWSGGADGPDPAW